MLTTLTAFTIALFCHACETTPRSATVRPGRPAAVESGRSKSPGDPVEIESTIYDAVKRKISISCARGETVGFHLNIQATNDSMDEVTFEADPLLGRKSKIDATSVEFFRAWFVEIDRWPAWHIRAVEPQDRRLQVADVLIPARAPKLGQPYEIAPGTKLSAWVDVSIPFTAAPGIYRSAIRILNRKKLFKEIPLEVRVLPFALPRDPGVTLLAPLNLQKLLGHHLDIDGRPFVPHRLIAGSPLYDDSVGLVHRTLRLLQRHRLSPYLTGIFPITQITERGELTIDWEDYDRIVEPFIKGELYPNQPPIAHWPIPFDENYPSPPPYDALTSPTYTRNLRQYLTLCSEHATQRGWIDKAFMLVPDADQISERAFLRTRSYGQIAKLSARKLPVVSFMPPQDLRPYGWENYPYWDLSDYVEVWCPPAQFFDATVFAQPQYQHHRKWLKLDRPPFSGSLELSAGETFARVIPFQAARLQAEAVLLPEVNNWTTDFTIRSPIDQIRQSPPPLILPGTFCGLDEPITTVRLKNLRRGMQDLGYVELCRDRGLLRAANTIQQSLCRYAGAEAYGMHFADGRFGGWMRDAAWWNRARDLLAKELSRQVDKGATEDQSSLDSTEWKSLLEATQQVELRSEGVRAALRQRPGALGPQFEIEFSLLVMNHSSETAWGGLYFGELPLTWTRMLDFQRFDELPPHSSKLITLRAAADSIPARDDGTLTVPVVMELTNREAKTYWIRVAHISAQRRSRPITLDGDLSDWPQGIGNVAGNFAPISRPPARESSKVTAESNRNVIGMVMADDEYIYMCFRVSATRQTSPEAIHRNYLEYDDRMPIGEDVLEILIDPSNGRSNSPGNLYHIAIKPTGSAFEEHGIRTDPQLGSVQEWSGHTRVVTRPEENGWVAELRIPFSAFGHGAKGRRTWGINFTRFDPTSWTYDTWSGALWNAYNPASLGNVSFSN